MDLPDIELIVQWKATCDLCTLWQRFGRAVRNQKLQGRALFFVETKYFDETKKKAALAAEKRKRKAEKNIAESRPSKRVCTTGSTQDIKLTEPSKDRRDHPEEEDAIEMGVMPVGQTGSNIDLAAIQAAKRLVEAERRVLYEKVPAAERKRGKRKMDDMEPALDDMINARSRPEINCSRLPATVYFRQSKYGAS